VVTSRPELELPLERRSACAVLRHAEQSAICSLACVLLVRDTIGDETSQMTISNERVIEIFRGLENGDGAAFFEHVADGVDWTVMGTHPLAGHYRSKQAFIDGTFAKLGRVLTDGVQLRVEHLLVKGDQAVVELHSLATARSGMRFDNRYCWVVEFRDGIIVSVRAYLDSAMVARLFDENPIL